MNYQNSRLDPNSITHKLSDDIRGHLSVPVNQATADAPFQVPISVLAYPQCSILCAVYTLSKNFSEILECIMNSKILKYLFIEGLKSANLLLCRLEMPSRASIE